MEHISLRLAGETLAKVDELRKRLEEKTGIPVNRADALRLLINKGLEASEK